MLLSPARKSLRVAAFERGTLFHLANANAHRSSSAHPTRNTPLLADRLALQRARRPVGQTASSSASIPHTARTPARTIAPRTHARPHARCILDIAAARRRISALRCVSCLVARSSVPAPPAAPLRALATTTTTTTTFTTQQSQQRQRAGPASRARHATLEPPNHLALAYASDAA
ncbi:hypothetical protein BST61_g10742 [Cercospora zeina]